MPLPVLAVSVASPTAVSTPSAAESGSAPVGGSMSQSMFGVFFLSAPNPLISRLESGWWGTIHFGLYFAHRSRRQLHKAGSST